MRKAEPMRFGRAVSQKVSDSDRVKPTFARLMTTIVQITQIEKPMCSAKIENARFFLAIRRPSASQKASSSGSQCSIQRPRREAARGLA
jgi:hypothetical protein